MWLSVKLLDFFQPISTKIEKKTGIGPQRLAGFTFVITMVTNLVSGDYWASGLCFWLAFHSFASDVLFPSLHYKQDHSIGSRVTRYTVLAFLPFCVVYSDNFYTKIEIVLCFVALNFMCCAKEVE